MSSAIIVNFDKPIDTEFLGFSKYNEKTLFHIGYKNFSLYEWIYTSLEGEGIYPEIFPNKRGYLEFIKKNKKKLKLNHFRLCEDLLKRLREIPQDFFLYVGDMSDINKLEMLPKSLLSLNEITDKTLLKENVVYRFSKY